MATASSLGRTARSGGGSTARTRSQRSSTPRTTRSWKPSAAFADAAEGRMTLYENAAGMTMLSPVDGPSACVGVDSLGQFFTASLFKAGTSIKWAKVVAAHLVWNCKTYASGYCGGNTHLIEIPSEGPAIFIDDQSIIRDLQSYLADINSALSQVLPSQDASDETVRHRLLALTNTLARLRNDVTIPVPTGALSFIGGTVQVFETPLPLREGE